MTHLASHNEEHNAARGCAPNEQQTAAGSSSSFTTCRASTRQTTDKAERLNRLAKLILGSSGVGSGGDQNLTDQNLTDLATMPSGQAALSCYGAAVIPTEDRRLTAPKSPAWSAVAAGSASDVAAQPAATSERDSVHISRASEALAGIPVIAIEPERESSKNLSVGSAPPAVDIEAIKGSPKASGSELLQPDRLVLSASQESLASLDCTAELSASLDESLLRLDKYGTLSTAGRLQPPPPPPPSTPCRTEKEGEQSQAHKRSLSSMTFPKGLSDGIQPDHQVPRDSAANAQSQCDVNGDSCLVTSDCKDRGAIRSTMLCMDETTELDDPPAAAEDDASSAAARIDSQLVRIDLHLHALDEQGQKIAKDMRLSGEEDGSRISLLLETVNRKNLLLRHESDLVCLSKQCELEAKQRQIESRLRLIAEKSDAVKTAEEKELQATLIEEKLAIVEQRHRLVLSIEEERMRQLEEDAGLLALLTTETASHQSVATRSESCSKKPFKKVKDRIKSTLSRRDKQLKKQDL